VNRLLIGLQACAGSLSCYPINRMAGFRQAPKFFLRLIHLPPRLAYGIGLGPLIGRAILLLTTIGRQSGKPRFTPLQYEEIDGRFYLGAALGQRADWVRNIQANPKVEVHVRSRRFSGLAETIADPEQIADFLEIRLRRHPKMIGAILRSEGIRLPPARSDLVRYAAHLRLIVIQPDANVVG
jgi:deazaflavin-dependent oxidoreductase (nitroreductase family)